MLQDPARLCSRLFHPGDGECCCSPWPPAVAEHTVARMTLSSAAVPHQLLTGTARGTAQRRVMATNPSHGTRFPLAPRQAPRKPDGHSLSLSVRGDEVVVEADGACALTVQIHCAQASRKRPPAATMRLIYVSRAFPASLRTALTFEMRRYAALVGKPSDQEGGSSESDKKGRVKLTPYRALRRY